MPSPSAARDLVLAITPFHEPNADLVVAVARAGYLGILDLGEDTAADRDRVMADFLRTALELITVQREVLPGYLGVAPPPAAVPAPLAPVPATPATRTVPGPQLPADDSERVGAHRGSHAPAAPATRPGRADSAPEGAPGEPGPGTAPGSVPGDAPEGAPDGAPSPVFVPRPRPAAQHAGGHQPGELRDAIRAVLGEPACRAAAARVSASYAAAGGAVTAACHLEKLL